MAKALLEWLLGVNEEHKRVIYHVEKITRKYPSAKIVGRGTLVIDPSDLVKSGDLTQGLADAKDIIRQNKAYEATHP